jgi:Family of unknown function (DUF5330)
MGLVRKVMIVTGGLAMMPSPPHDSIQAADAETYVAAAATLSSDAADYCGQKPGVCRVAGYMAAKLEHKARYGAELLYRWTVPDQPNGLRIVDAMETGSTSSASSKETASTLKLDDLIPAWIGPEPKKG